MNRFDASLLWDAAVDNVEEGPKDLSSVEEDAKSEQLTNPGQADGGGVVGDWVDMPVAQSIYVPLHYEANYRYPLIVWLHSDGYNENQVCHVMPHVSTRNYLATGVRAPKAIDASGHQFCWFDSDTAVDLAESSVFKGIKRIAGDYSVHPERIVLAGYGHGGSMATRIAMRNPRRFAATISLGGSLGSLADPGIDMGQLRGRRMPMLWQWATGRSDYCEQGLTRDIQSAIRMKAVVEVRQYREDDEMNTVVLADLNQWIMKHVVQGCPVVSGSEWDSNPTMFSDN